MLVNIKSEKYAELVWSKKDIESLVLGVIFLLEVLLCKHREVDTEL